MPLADLVAPRHRWLISAWGHGALLRQTVITLRLAEAAGVEAPYALIGARADGNKELVTLDDGHREFSESWADSDRARDSERPCGGYVPTRGR